MIPVQSFGLALSMAMLTVLRDILVRNGIQMAKETFACLVDQANDNFDNES